MKAVAGVIVTIVALPVLAVGGMGAGASAVSCDTTASVVANTGQLTDEQRGNASAIIAAGRAKNVPDRGIIIALAVAQQESTLLNMPNGDRDSIGLFQQRPSQGWGTPEQVHDPVYAAGKFYDRLVEVPNWQSLPVTVAGQAVQRSAFPDAYARWEPMATAALGAAGADTTTACSPTDLPAYAGGADPGPGPQGPDHYVPRSRALTAALRQAFPEIKDIGGWRPYDAYPDHPSGRALDVMMPGGGRTPEDVVLGDRVAEFVTAHAGDFGVDYMIWRQRIRSVPRDGQNWRPMGDRGDWTQNHMDHVHVTVLP